MSTPTTHQGGLSSPPPCPQQSLCHLSSGLSHQARACKALLPLLPPDLGSPNQSPPPSLCLTTSAPFQKDANCYFSHPGYGIPDQSIFRNGELIFGSEFSVQSTMGEGPVTEFQALGTLHPWSGSHVLRLFLLFPLKRLVVLLLLSSSFYMCMCPTCTMAGTCIDVKDGGRSLDPACFEVGSLLSLLCCIRLAGPRFPSGLRVAEAMVPFVIAGFLHGFLESSSGS